MLLQIRRQAANEQLEAVAQFKELNYKVQVQELIEQYDTDRQALVSTLQLDLTGTQAGRDKLKQLVAATTHSTCMSLVLQCNPTYNVDALLMRAHHRRIDSFVGSSPTDRVTLISDCGVWYSILDR